jgi:site-specific recombinase
MGAPRSDPSALLANLDPHASVAQRHLWLMAVLAWVRGNGQDTRASVGRIELLLDALASNPQQLQAWHSWWATFRQQMDLAPLLADFGFAPRTAFLSELGFRLRNKLLPGTPDTTHPSELFSLLFPTASDAHWIAALPPSLLQRLHHVSGGAH